MVSDQHSHEYSFFMGLRPWLEVAQEIPRIDKVCHRDRGSMISPDSPSSSLICVSGWQTTYIMSTAQFLGRSQWRAKFQILLTLLTAVYGLLIFVYTHTTTWQMGLLLCSFVSWKSGFNLTHLILSFGPKHGMRVSHLIQDGNDNAVS